MEKVTILEAADRLKLTRLTVQVLLREDRLPIGYAVKNPGSSKYHYVIYKELLEKYAQSIEDGSLLDKGSDLCNSLADQSAYRQKPASEACSL